MELFLKFGLLACGSPWKTSKADNLMKLLKVIFLFVKNMLIGWVQKFEQSNIHTNQRSSFLCSLKSRVVVAGC